MIRWGIVGLGNMANQFANAIKEDSMSKIRFNICCKSKMLFLIILIFVEDIIYSLILEQ